MSPARGFRRSRAFGSRRLLRAGSRSRRFGGGLVTPGGCRGRRLFRGSVSGRTLKRRGRRNAGGHCQHAHCEETCSPDFSPYPQRKTFASHQSCGLKSFQKTKGPTGRWHCNHPRWTHTVPVPVGPFSVTEVYRAGKWFRPAATNRAAAPGTQRPGRSSGSIRSGRNLPRC